MAEVSIRAHTRRGKNGKTVQVQGYTRRVGRKGIHSPKRSKISKPGDEFQSKMEEKKVAPEKKSPEETAAERRRLLEWQKDYERAEAERKSLNMTRHQYSQYRLGLNKRKTSKSTSKSANTRVKNPLSTEGSLNILERIENKIATFVDKYGGGRKYKKQL